MNRDPSLLLSGVSIPYCCDRLVLACQRPVEPKSTRGAVPVREKQSDWLPILDLVATSELIDTIREKIYRIKKKEKNLTSYFERR